MISGFRNGDYNSIFIYDIYKQSYEYSLLIQYHKNMILFYDHETKNGGIYLGERAIK